MSKCPQRRGVSRTPQLACISTLPCPELAQRGLRCGPRSMSTTPRREVSPGGAWGEVGEGGGTSFRVGGGFHPKKGQGSSYWAKEYSHCQLGSVNGSTQHNMKRNLKSS